MKKQLLASLLAASTLLSTSALSTERMYGVAGVGFGDAELDGTSSNGASYRLALGHQFHRQWYVELGYQNLVDDEPSGFGEGLAAEALTLSALGKAGNRHGELFYRVGIANIDVQGQALADQQGVCAVGDVVGSVVDVGTFCGFDEGILGGVFGLGFDFHVGFNGMVRIEAEYLVGERDFSTGAVYVGYRYNFN